jgi:beta-D-xylosidase 4
MSKQRVAVIGPYANATTQMQGDYSGTAKDIVSPLRAAQSIGGVEVMYAEGTAINTTNTTGFAAALSAAQQADFVIYLGGLDNSLEQEQLDRTTLTWPGNQLDLINQLANTSKPLVVVQFGGGQIDDAPLLSHPGVNGLLWAGYPSQDGGPAIMDIITGKVAPAGRLPITQYAASYVDEVSIYDINLRSNGSYPGRTNRFYTGKPTLPFGYGLSYTTFGFEWRRTLKSQYNVQDLVTQLSGTLGDLNDATPFSTVTVQGKRTSRVYQFHQLTKFQYPTQATSPLTTSVFSSSAALMPAPRLARSRPSSHMPVSTM